MPEYYEIKLKCHLEESWQEWLAGMQVQPLDNDLTLLCGWLPDQTALHGLLERIRDLNLPLLSVVQGEAPAQPNSSVK